AEALGQFGCDPHIGSSFADRWHRCPTQLDAFLRLLRYLEADAQAFTFPRRIDGEHDVRLLRRRIEKEIAMHRELELLERASAQSRCRLRNQEVGPEPDQRAHPVGLGIEEGAIDVGTGHPAARWRTDRTQA